MPYQIEALLFGVGPGRRRLQEVAAPLSDGLEHAYDDGN